MWLQAIQLINILLSAQNHRGDLLIQDQQRQVQQHQDHTQIVANGLEISRSFVFYSESISHLASCHGISLTNFTLLV